MLLGPQSLVPLPSDFRDVVRQFRYFVGLGPRPKWDRWTYWEKFDYWAVFWGVAVIGSTGLVMWFPEFFCSFLPGWIVNISLLVHSEEALLAIGFIFSIHFFNNHLRVEKFPMDPVIFTGSVPEEELREERPLEYERLKAEGRLDSLRVSPPEPGTIWWARVVGILAWSLALTLLALILVGTVTR
jgi:cytochrome b subunit of formate dehydrogenase